jgi:hypothetical protein
MRSGPLDRRQLRKSKAEQSCTVVSRNHNTGLSSMIEGTICTSGMAHHIGAGENEDDAS